MNRRILIAIACLMSTALLVPPSAAATDVLKVPGDYPSIGDAIAAADAGDIIKVSAGIYAEHVVLNKSHVRLRGSGAVIDGTTLGGSGLGIHVDDADNVEIKGFIVENFERGIVLEGVTESLVHLNEVRDNTDKDTSDGNFNLADGITLIGSDLNVVRNNDVHDNGHNGIFLRDGSSGNIVRGNRSNDNGAQTLFFGPPLGCGIQLTAAGNDNNQIVENETRRNAWGILLGPSGDSSGNLIGQNRSHENSRAGIGALGDANNNFIQQNNATGNGVENLPPSDEFDLYDGSAGPNAWLNNQGSSNF